MSKAFKITMRERPFGLLPLGFVLCTPLIALPLGGWLVESGLLVLARCSFKTFFSLPCMGCGATRATLNFLHGDWLEAFLFQPLTIFVYVLLAVWGAISLALYIAGRDIEIELATWLTWTVRITFILLPFINWAYLVAADV